MEQEINNIEPAPIAPSAGRSRWRTVAIAFVTFLCLIIANGAYHVFKPLPDGLNFYGQAQHAWDVRFLSDTTYTNENGVRFVKQEIFDEALGMIGRARKLVLLDMFLFNDFQGPRPEQTRRLSDELTQSIIERKKAVPSLRVVFITDPINTVYGGMESRQLDALKKAGVEVVITRLNILRDSNPIYSALWRPLISPFGNSTGGTWLPNPFGQGRVSLRSWLEMLNFKANHRKVLVADDEAAVGGWSALVTSANPHDASSAHGNVAIKFSGDAVADIIRSENAVLSFSGGRDVYADIKPTDAESAISAAVLTEKAIKNALKGTINSASHADRISISVFYLSDRDIIKELKDAYRRGSDIRVVLDPNIDAFGHRKNGIPNRQSGLELMEKGIKVRWCDTHGEQCHAKMMLVDYADGVSRLIAGSANYTRRNLENLNLETDIQIAGPSDAPVFTDAREYFETIWKNEPSKTYTADFGRYRETSLWKAIIMHTQEATGLCTF